jgi:hypothetical protein
VTLLQSLGAADAWLDPSQRLLAPYPAPKAPPGAQRTTANAPARADGGSPFADNAGGRTAPRTAAGRQGQGRQGGGGGQRPEGAPLSKHAAVPAVLGLRDVVREARVFAAAAAVHGRVRGLAILEYGLSTQYVFEQLLGHDMLPEALQLAHALWAGQHLSEQLALAAAAVAARCAELQQQGGGGALQPQEAPADAQRLGGSGGAQAAAGATGAPAGVPLSHTGPRFLGSRAAAAWQTLQQMLELYDSYDCLGAGGGAPDAAAPSMSVLGASLRLAAVDGLLRVQPRMALPAWLLQPFLPPTQAGGAPDAAGAVAGGMADAAADPAALLRLYMQHGRLLDAAQLAVSHLDAWQRCDVLQRVQPMAVWLPLCDMQLLHASLMAGAQRAREVEGYREAELLSQAAELLGAAVAAHVALAQRDTQALVVGTTALASKAQQWGCGDVGGGLIGA